MYAEPAIVDANILIYASDAPQHNSSRALLEAAQAETPLTLYVTSQILSEFYAIVTNPRRFKKPCQPSEALAAISDMLGFLRALPVPVNTDDFKPFSEIDILTP